MEHTRYEMNNNLKISRFSEPRSVSSNCIELVLAFDRLLSEMITYLRYLVLINHNNADIICVKYML